MAGTEAEPHARPRRARRARGGAQCASLLPGAAAAARRAGRLPRSGQQVGRPPPSCRVRASRRREDPPPPPARGGEGPELAGQVGLPGQSWPARCPAARVPPCPLCAGRAQHAPSFSRGPRRWVSEVPGSQRRERRSLARGHTPPWEVRAPGVSPGLCALSPSLPGPQTTAAGSGTVFSGKSLRC